MHRNRSSLRGMSSDLRDPDDPAHPRSSASIIPPSHNDHSAHHLHEFGEIDNVVHIRQPSDASTLDSTAPVAPVSNTTTRHAMRHRINRLMKHLFRERHLKQYMYNGTLFRSPDLRKVSREELFLDLVIVAATAALGHELRSDVVGWAAVEKFILLFFAIYIAWVQVVFLWNLWGVKEDIYEKLGIYASFMAITGIALGSNRAFEDGVRSYVSVSAFVATAVPAVGNVIISHHEPLMHNPNNKFSEANFMFAFRIIPSLCYLSAAFASTESAARHLYWYAIVTNVLSNLVYIIYSRMHRSIDGLTRMALNIEVLVEKYEVLTMIVLGESVIGLLFEAVEHLGRDGARVAALYLCAVACTLMLYGMQTFYIQVDSLLTRGGVHAVRHNSITGILWNLLHMPYHLFLVLFATGMSISVRDIVVPPTQPLSRALAEAAGERAEEALGIPEFSRSARWAFAVGWAGSVVLSAAIASLHKAGPRAATKKARLFTRCALAAVLLAVLPRTDISAGAFQAVFCLVTVCSVLVEFVLVQMDRIGFFTAEYELAESTVTEELDDDDDEIDDLQDGDEMFLDAGDNERSEVGALNSSLYGAAECPISQELRQRVLYNHAARLLPVKPKRSAAAARNAEIGEKQSLLP